MTKKSSKKAFTLVELIIVIAIIAILAVTAFLLLTKWLAKARDASRSSNLANIENSLQISLTENSSLPKPDSYVLIYASGTTNVIGYQGYFGEGVKDSVGNINSAPKDGDDYFTYYLNGDLNKYQLGAFMENEIAYNPNVVSAVDYASRYINVRGDKLGLLTDSNKSPLQTLGLTGLDLLTGTASYIAYFDNSDNVAGTGKQLFTYYYNKIKSLLQNKDLAKADDNLVFYSDMETLSGTLISDLSKYGNNGKCYNRATQVNCGDVGGPQFVQGHVGKAMQFDGSGDYISIQNLPNQISGDINLTFVVNITPTKFVSDDFQTIIGDSWYRFLLSIRQNSSDIGFGTKDSSNTQRNSGNSHLNLNSSYQIVGLVNAEGDRKLYVNGELKKKSSYGPNSFKIGNSNVICIGSLGDPGNQDFFNGTIDEVRIYNRALSNDEVKAIYDATN